MWYAECPISGIVGARKLPYLCSRDSNLYLITDTDLYGDTYGYALKINNTANYSNIGKLKYNNRVNSLSSAGYMYNKIYLTSEKWLYSSETNYSEYFVPNSLLVADSYELVSHNYKLVNPYTISIDNNDFSSLIGKYTFAYYDYNPSTYIGESIFYIAGATDEYLKLIYITNGLTAEYYNYAYTYGDSYTKNNDGTYTVNNPQIIYKYDMVRDDDTSLNGKYVCSQTTNNTCEELRHVSYVSHSLNYFSTNNTYKYGSTFFYENGKYHLSGEVIDAWDWYSSDELQRLNNTQYTCWNETGECEKISFIYDSGSSMEYYTIENGESAEEAFDNMLFADDVNKKNSIVKSGIDSWFLKNLYNNYNDYLEETIFCNDRYVKKTGGWIPDGSDLNNYLDYLRFNGSSYTYKSLYCMNETDRFSISNEKAKLKYNVGMISMPENHLSQHYSSRRTGEDNWTITPEAFGSSRYGPIITYHMANGSYDDQYIYNTELGARPVISLKQGTKVTGGDGTTENPYIMEYNHSINVVIKNETKDLDIEIADISSVPEGEQVTFTVTPIKGFKITGIQIVDSSNEELTYQETSTNNQYTFIMPGEDVTIIPSYERTAAAVNVEENPHTKEIVIEVNDATAVVYEDVVRFTVEAEEGYELVDIEITDEEGNEIEYHKTSNDNEYEFIMPDTNVLIKPIYKEIPKPEEPETKPIINPNTGRTVAWIGFILLIIIMTLLQKKNHKKIT